MTQAPDDRRLVEGSQFQLLVAVGGQAAAIDLVRHGRSLAGALNVPWEAVHVETPFVARDGEDPQIVADALALAAQLGAGVASVPGATVADGLEQHLADAPVGHVVLGCSVGRANWLPWRRSLLQDMLRRRPDLRYHLFPHARGPVVIGVEPHRVSLAGYGIAVALVALTLVAAAVLNATAGVRSLSFLFLFPVIAAAARLGVRPALVAALLSAAVYNVVFLEPAFALKPLAIQTWVMAAVLAAVAIYTATLTSTLRGRVALSDRSAQENAKIASFALNLTRVSDWTSTAQVVCEQVGTMLDVRTVIMREVAGSLVMVAGFPEDPELSPLDRTALDWAWANGRPAGHGASVISSADWQFQPLVTSLGTLAVLGLAREDGQNPVPADRAVLLSTLVAQAALAHERLRLEDQMRAGAGPDGTASGA